MTHAVVGFCRRALLLVALIASCNALSDPFEGSMYLATRGIGDTLIFPYYTVNAGQSTLFSVVNTSAKDKILELNYREGSAGEVVGNGVVFLAAHDSYTFTVFALDGTGVGNILSDDSTCAIPFPSASLPALPRRTSLQTALCCGHEP